MAAIRSGPLSCQDGYFLSGATKLPPAEGVIGDRMRKSNPYKKADHFTKEARAAGYPARSVFKLEEIDRRVRLLRSGMRVLDLGASPGSWALYAAKKVGQGGKVLAVDLKALETALPTNAVFVLGDAFSLEDASMSQFAPYDVVLSDMAPNTTGNRLGDQTRSFELFMRALEVGGRLLKPGGAFVGKIFMGEDLPLARAAVKKLFSEERLIRPEGTRSVSYEIFVVATGRRAQ
jgi:23S rRNA (uridine2552-2'-O)-methyltransferase